MNKTKSQKKQNKKEETQAGTPQIKEKKVYQKTKPKQCPHCEDYFARLSTHTCTWLEVEKRKIKRRIEDSKGLSMQDYISLLEQRNQDLIDQINSLKVQNMDLISRNKDLENEYEKIYDENEFLRRRNCLNEIKMMKSNAEEEGTLEDMEMVNMNNLLKKKRFNTLISIKNSKEIDQKMEKPVESKLWDEVFGNDFSTPSIRYFNKKLNELLKE
jgi:hypothetical protein